MSSVYRQLGARSTKSNLQTFPIFGQLFNKNNFLNFSFGGGTTGKHISTVSKDDYQTPPEAVYPLLKYIPVSWKIWECASGKGNLTNAFKERGHVVTSSDILYDEKFDFLTYEAEKYDCIITNPPYSKKMEFLMRCYELKKPFALLMPISTLETRSRQEIFQNNGVQILFLGSRIRFETPDGKKGKQSSPQFETAWFTNGMNLPNVLNYADMKDYQTKHSSVVPQKTLHEVTNI